MNIRNHSLLASVLCVALTSHLFAQTPRDNPAATPAKPSAAAAAAPVVRDATPISERRFDVEFDGLNLAEAMDIMRQKLPDLNIVVPPSLNSAPIGLLKLRNVSVLGLVRAISAATDSRVEGQFDDDSYLTFVSNDGIPQPESVCRVLSLRQYLDGKKDDEMDRAIRDLNEVVEMARMHLEKSRPGVQMKTPEFSVHRATKLLIVVGSPESVSIVEEVVTAVSNGSVGPAFPGGFGGGANPFGTGGFPGASGFGGGNNPAGAPRGVPQPSPTAPRGGGAAPQSTPLGEKF